MQQSLASPDVVAALHGAAAVDVLSVGKAAHVMSASFMAACPVPMRHRLTVGSGDAGHPLPDARSVTAATRALRLAASASKGDLLIVLLSGGASALMSLPAADLTLADKQAAVQRLLEAGADIGELNTVRKHLSAVKGGRLAAACAGRVLTLVISDVVGDDLSVIGSGPTVADPTSWREALDVIARRGGEAAFPVAAVELLRRGLHGEVPDTPKPGDSRLSRSDARVIGGRADAVAGARAAAQALGYHVHVLHEPIVGEARQAAQRYMERVHALRQSLPMPSCVVSAGETTVTVRGRGRGGRNQEFALALVRAMAGIKGGVALASVGTDGIDGPTDAAGAYVDPTTLRRASALRLDPDAALDDNDSHTFFLGLDDLIRPGPADTNVGDLQVFLLDE